MTDIAELARRIARTESRQAIGELPARYAIALDSRDIDGWIGLFVDDVDCGRRGKGREALRTFIDPSVRTFYRSIHQICGHVVDFIDDDTATGTVYCRAEHEDGDKWVERLPDLPGDFPTWNPFWSGMNNDALSALTRQP